MCTDVRELLPVVQAPTLVFQRAHDQIAPAELGQYLADHIAGAKYVELDGTDHLWFTENTDEIVDDVEEFLTGARTSHDPDRMLATVLFTDIVGSTARAVELGDTRWRARNLAPLHGRPLIQAAPDVARRASGHDGCRATRAAILSRFRGVQPLPCARLRDSTVVHVSAAELAACLAIVALGAFVQGSVGFGLNLIVVPVIAVLVPGAVPGSVVLLSLPLTVTMVIREHHHIDRHGVAWVMAGRLPGALIGTAVVVLVAHDVLTSIIGAAILAGVGLSLANFHLQVRAGTAAGAGLVAGVMGTAAGIDGPPLALLYQHHRSEAIRATLAACFVLGTLMSATTLAIAGEIRSEQLVFTLELLPALLVGFAASTWGARHLRDRSTRPAVLIFATVAGTIALVSGLT